MADLYEIFSVDISKKCGIIRTTALDHPANFVRGGGKMTFFERHAEKTLVRLESSFPAVLVTGARQTGKTSLLKKITAAKSVRSTTFDDIAEERSARTDPKTFLELHPSPYMFDEVQYVPDFFRYLKIEIDKNRRNGMFYLTGQYTPFIRI